MKRALTLILSLIAFAALGQELINSQFYLNRVFTNPAFIGEQSGYRLNINSRVQWRNIPSNKVLGNYYLNGAAIDLPLCAFGQNAGIGARFSNESHGEAGLQTNSGYFGYSYNLIFSTLRGRNKLSKIRNTLSGIRFGLELGFLQRSVDGNRLVYSDQIDPVQGVVRNSSNNNLPLANKFSFNSSVGTILSWNLSKFKSTPFKRLYTGYAIHNLLMPNVNLLSSNIDERLPRRHTVHATALFDEKWPVALLAHTRYMWLQNTGTNVFDIFINGVKQTSNKSGTHFSIGAGFRTANSSYTNNMHAVLTAIGFTWGDGSQAMIGADMNVGGFSNGAISTWECSLVFNFGKPCKSFKTRGKKGNSFLGCAEL